MADVRIQGRPTDAFVDEGERAFSAYLRSVVGRGAYVPGQGWTGDTRADVEPLEIGPPVPGLEQFASRLPRGRRMQPVLAETGIFAFSPGDAPRYEEGEDESLIILTGGVSIQYEQRATATDPELMLEFVADRVVIFLPPGSSPWVRRVGPGESGGPSRACNGRVDDRPGWGDGFFLGLGFRFFNRFSGRLSFPRPASAAPFFSFRPNLPAPLVSAVLLRLDILCRRFSGVNRFRVSQANGKENQAYEKKADQ